MADEDEPTYDENDGGDGGDDDDVDAMRRRVEEMEAEAAQLQALQDNVQKEASGATRCNTMRPVPFFFLSLFEVSPAFSWRWMFCCVLL